jgi:hypothetical protein
VIATLIAAVAIALPLPEAPAWHVPAPTTRDDTSWLQQRLDDGGTTFLPRLPGDECYRTSGLWISHDDTALVSDGACVVAIGSGPVRLTLGADAVAADAILYVNRTNEQTRAPAHVTIAGLRLFVPRGVRMFGIEIQAHDVEVANVEVNGSPKDAVLVDGRGTEDGSSSGVWIHDSRLRAGGRNVVSVTSARDVRIERCEISGASDTAYLPETHRSHGNPAAGIDVEPDSPGAPAVDIAIVGNRIAANAGAGVIVSLNPWNRPALFADGITIAGNGIVANGRKPTPPVRGGIVVSGGRAGHIEIADNVISRNHGFGLSGATRMVVDAHGNTFAGNSAGAWHFGRLGRGSRIG